MIKNKKEIYVEKVKINKLGSILYFVGFLFMAISGVVLMFNTSSTDRAQVVAWILLGVSGYYLYTKFNLVYSSKIRKKHKGMKKINKKQVDKLVKYFALLFLISSVVNMVIFYFLMETNLSNLVILLIYFPTAFGWASSIIVFGIIILLLKNKFEIRNITQQLKIGLKGGKKK